MIYDGRTAFRDFEIHKVKEYRRHLKDQIAKLESKKAADHRTMIHRLNFILK